jgi:hypothetical protein
MSKRLLPIVALALVASPSWAALTLNEAKCQKKAAAAGRGLFKSVAKALEKCHDKVSAGQLPPATDCSLEPTTAQKIAQARSKIALKVPASCPDAIVAALVFGGDCTGLGTAASLATCFADTHEDQALALMATLYGPGGAVASPQIDCQKTVAKESVKYALSRLVALQKCARTRSPPASCRRTRPAPPSRNRREGQQGEAKALGKIGDRCPDSERGRAHARRAVHRRDHWSGAGGLHGCHPSRRREPARRGRIRPGRRRRGVGAATDQRPERRLRARADGALPRR